jgi:Leucine-rich repeat (LRR) protein
MSSARTNSALDFLVTEDNNLTGTLPTELGLLGKLRWVYLDSNLGIQGSIPDSYENLKNLEVFALQCNELSGSIPDWIDSWSNLKVLSLSNNALTGILPASMSRMTNLKGLSLDINMLSGYIGEIGTLINLQRVYLGSNKFEGRIDDNFLRNHKALVHLDLSKNLMTGTVPPHFFQVENMTVMDLHGNKLDGTMPNFVENNILQFLSLHDNEISERVPPSIINLKSLTHLDIAGNNFSQVIPTQLSLMSGLEHLFLGNNPFAVGPVPDFSKLVNLTQLSLKATQLSGYIPTWLGKLNKLSFLDLGMNGLNGQMPSEIGNLESLRVLLFDQNKLTGPIPNSFKHLAQLKTIFLDNNTITGLTSAVCALHGLDVFLSDCGGLEPELECTCCEYCCEDAATSCLEKDSLSRFDPIWNFKYERDDEKFTGSFIKS